MLAHIIAYLTSMAIGITSVKFCLIEANRTRRTIKQNYLNELHAHQCGRALALIKNIESAARRLRPKSTEKKDDSQSLSKSVAEVTSHHITSNIMSYYQTEFSMQGTNCIDNPSHHLIATTYLLNDDEDDPETGYFSYRVQSLQERKTN